MKLLFCRSYLPGSYLIRLMTFSQWSHVAVVFDDGTAIEATWPKVRVSTADKIIKAHSAHEYRELPISAEGALFLWAQVGKPYDVGGLLMYLNPWRKWEEDDSWFCSELVAKANGQFECATRVSPQMLHLLSRPL